MDVSRVARQSYGIALWKHDTVNRQDVNWSRLERVVRYVVVVNHAQPYQHLGLGIVAANDLLFASRPICVKKIPSSSIYRLYGRNYLLIEHLHRWTTWNTRETLLNRASCEQRGPHNSMPLARRLSRLISYDNLMTSFTCWLHDVTLHLHVESRRIFSGSNERVGPLTPEDPRPSPVSYIHPAPF